MKYKLIAIDMDGTLLDSDRRISEKNMISIKTAQKKGVRIVISTGRPVKGVSRYKELMDLNSPVIAYNGSMIMDPVSKEILFEQKLKAQDARNIIKMGIEQETTMCIWSKDRLYGNRIDDRINDYKSYSGVEPILIEDYEALYSQGITKILWYDDAEKVADLEKKFNRGSYFQEVCCCKSLPFFLEFFHGKVSKADALGRLGELYDIKPEEMIAIGDANNDISMLKFAGLGIAMGNADEILKKIADAVTLSNDEDGVAEAIKRYVLDQ